MSNDDQYLPAMNSGTFEAISCRTTPREKTRVPIMSEGFRPTWSPNGAAANAPKKFPALNIDTTADDCAGEILGSDVFESM